LIRPHQEYKAPLNEQEVTSGEGFALHQIDKSQLTGVLSDSGNQMKLTALTTAYNPDGSQKGDSFPDTANGIRIPLEVLPNTSNTLPIPEQPTEQP
jgi:hypothetical protein